MDPGPNPTISKDRPTGTVPSNVATPASASHLPIYIYIYIFTVGRIYTRTRSRFYNIIFTCAREIYSGKMCVEALSTPQSNSTEKDILVFPIPSLSSASEMRKPGPLSALSSLLLV